MLYFFYHPTNYRRVYIIIPTALYVLIKNLSDMSSSVFYSICIYNHLCLVETYLFFLIYLQFTSWSFCCSIKWISPVWDTHSSSPVSPSSAHRGSPAFPLILQDLCLTIFCPSRWRLLLLYFLVICSTFWLIKLKKMMKRFQTCNSIWPRVKSSHPRRRRFSFGTFA